MAHPPHLAGVEARLIYGSVCSGIEAASVAWAPLGWRCAFVSEIDAFPQAVLRHHYGVNTLGYGLSRRSRHDRRPGAPWNFGDFTTIRTRTLRRLHVPALDVLVGGTPCQAFSIAGDRAGLDDPRGNLTLEFLVLVRRLRPRWIVWENVPGVLSIDEGRVFGTFLGALGQFGYGLAYRVLDAQFFRVPQRRRRVFVVGHLGAWQPAAAVLFEAESLHRDTPPRRKAREGVARPLGACAPGGSGYRNDADTAENLVAHPLLAKGHCSFDSTLETYITHALTAEGHDASEDGSGRGTPLIPCAFDSKASGRNGFGVGDVSPTLRAMGHARSHQNAGGQVAVAIPIQDPGNSRKGQGGVGVGDDGAPAYTLQAEQQHAVALSFQERGRADGRSLELGGDVAYALTSPNGGGRTHELNILDEMAVRRLTPRECERLQGFPDDFTKIGETTPDGPRYRALGNSMAVPVMRWIGSRIDAVDRVLSEAGMREAEAR